MFRGGVVSESKTERLSSRYVILKLLISFGALMRKWTLPPDLPHISQLTHLPKHLRHGYGASRRVAVLTTALGPNISHVFAGAEAYPGMDFLRIVAWWGSLVQLCDSRVEIFLKS